MKRGFLNSSKVKEASLKPTKMHPAFANGTSLNLAYGKVDDTSLPEDYDAKNEKVVYKETDAGAVDYPERQLLITTIPGQSIGRPPDPDNHSEWLVHGPTKRKILNAPGYPQPTPKPRRPDMFVIKSTSTMGMGVFATCDIKSGELIFSERPLIVTPRAIGLDTTLPTHYTVRQIQQVSMYQWEKNLEIAVGRMSKENQEAFKALMNNHKEDGSGPLLGIIRTNGYGVSDLADGPDGMKEIPDGNMYGAVCKIGSRINHSCMPNITHSFKRASFSLQFTASRDIKAGEQFFYAYCDLGIPVAERRRALAPYGLVCQCAACVNATPESDRFRQEWVQRVMRYSLQCTRWLRDPNLTVDAVKPVLQFDKDVIKEGLHGSEHYGRLAVIINAVHMKLGMQKEVGI